MQFLMKGQYSHSWQVDFKQAKIIQEELAKRVKITKLPSSLKKIAGFDVSYLKAQDLLIGGMVVMNLPSLEIVETRIRTSSISFPYVPGYLSFREAPVLLDLISTYRKKIDLFLFDGHGIAHPRGLGIAAHIGVLIDKPSLGCAKKKLVGLFNPPAPGRGATSDLIYQGKIIGKVVRTKTGIKPVFVSVGHRTDLQQGVALILSCCRKYRLPEPLRQAHQLVTAWRKAWAESQTRKTN
jgi:deoxyribonuclease V